MSHNAGIYGIEPETNQMIDTTLSYISSNN